MTSETSTSSATSNEGPAFRYTAELANRIEREWQDRWEREATFAAPNPSGPLGDPSALAREKLYVLDMFPYPSGAGLHVGHPLGYIGTDVFGRFKRMTGHNVLHALGYDAFGLPAEQYAVQTGQHPRVTTEANVANMRRQLRALGLAHDPRRSVSTTDVEFYRWTQWIFLQVFNSWYDTALDRARPIAELVAAFEDGSRSTPDGTAWNDLTEGQRRALIDEHRLAFLSDAPVNWCPGLGTVLANEEVTADGRSERGNFPVFKRNLRQWMMRITAYADRLIDDLDGLDWSEAIKLMQRNWIGRSTGARVSFAVSGVDEPIVVFTTRPDTLFGATYMVLAPEHPLVESLTPAAWPEGTPASWTGGAATPAEAVAAYRAQAAAKSDVERQADAKVKTGVFTGTRAINPVNGAEIPVFIADYVLTGYGTGAIMAVPAEDERDWAFAAAFDLPVIRTVQPPADWTDGAWTGDGPSINSANNEISLNGLGKDEAKAAMIEWLELKGCGEATVQYKLRDWLFSRQRYWGEPFPVVYDEHGVVALPESMLPVELPEIADYSPRTFDMNDAESNPESPLGRATEWTTVTLDLGDGPKQYRRETNTMPQWAGSCWYELRYLDPTNSERFVDPEVEKYWMGPRTEGDCGGVDLYVGGVEHAVLHLLYARFWHKVLFDLGHVSSSEPFRRLFNQGYIQAYAYTDERGMYVPAADVVEADGGWTYEGAPVNREYGKMGKGLKNSVTPDEICAEYGADTLRIYEMSMGPMDVSRPWDTRAVIGSFRFLQRLWRNVVDEDTGKPRVSDAAMDDATARVVAKAVDGVTRDLENLRYNTAIAKLIEANNHLTKVVADTGAIPRSAAEPMVLMLAPLAPHLAEELWALLGHSESLTYAPFPVADPALLVEDTVTCILQVAGKVRDKIEVPADIADAVLQELALASEKVQASLDGRPVRTVVVRAPKLVNIVPG
ncbi:MAG: leucine--tRNA ligase [Sporichthyaceae bacterium]